MLIFQIIWWWSNKQTQDLTNEVIDTKWYGKLLKEKEAQKIKVAEENLSKFDSNGNPKVEVSEIKNENHIPQNNDTKITKQEIKHPKIENFMTET